MIYFFKFFPEIMRNESVKMTVFKIKITKILDIKFYITDTQ